MGRILVAGIGNIFLGDDGFGVEVARRLGSEPLGEGVDVADFGVRGIHLAYELADGRYDAAILVDAIARGGPPGTLYLVEPDLDGDIEPDAADAHSFTPAAVLAWIHRIGARCRIVIVGCEPASIDEGMALSPQVAGSIDGGVRMVRDAIAQLNGVVPCV